VCVKLFYILHRFWISKLCTIFFFFSYLGYLQKRFVGKLHTNFFVSKLPIKIFVGNLPMNFFVDNLLAKFCVG